ncbi:hypothetical protein [Litoreibacter roseus]|uniref:Uncharacterized protein n=1 Tax=Litoreibacter roseus TaxID=2601869 RepID=A0A6N6JK59_9RHOB|nr:hypothetical protein [Litoreibacter roseus]GFE66686.1 hypothetical protein KIN_37600 [Litoreibacter roseus]
MADLSQLEQRITQALDKIAAGVEAGLNKPAPDPASVSLSDLTEELEIERATNERLVAGREKTTAQIERLDIRVERLTKRLEAADTENKRLEAVIEALSENNSALREANAAHQPADVVVDASLSAQLADLKASRKADLDELDDILAELAPLVKEA